MSPWLEALVEGAVSLIPFSLSYKSLMRKKKGFGEEYMDEAAGGFLGLAGVAILVTAAIRLAWRIWHG